MAVLLLGLVPAWPGVVWAEDEPRYLFFNIAPGREWKQQQPETFTREVIDEVTSTLHVTENPRLRVGVSFLFSTMETPTNILAQSLRRRLAASVPVLVALDGQNWWQHRPDLWNWWEITREDIGKVTQQYLEKLCRQAYELGLPREVLFTHQGGTYAPWDKHLPFWPAFNRWSLPGWSFYHGGPREATPLAAEMKAAKRERWAAAEWW